MESNNRKLYDNIINSKRATVEEVGDFNTFNSMLQDSTNVVKLYQNLIKGNRFKESEIGTQDQFMGLIDPIPGSQAQLSEFDKFNNRQQQSDTIRPTINPDSVMYKDLNQPKAGEFDPVEFGNQDPLTQLGQGWKAGVQNLKGGLKYLGGVIGETLDNFDGENDIEWDNRLMESARRNFEAAPQGKGIWYELGSFAPQMIGIAAASVAAPLTAGTSFAAIPMIIGGANIAMLVGSASGSAMNEYDQYKDYKGEDGSDLARIGVGIASGAAEYLAERIGLDRYMPKGSMSKAFSRFLSTNDDVAEKIAKDAIKKNPSIAKDFVKRTAKNAVEEGTEEGITEIGNILIETVYKDKEDYDQFEDIVERIGSAFRGGAMMGGVLSPITYTADRAYKKKMHFEKDGVNYIATGQDKEGNIIADELADNFVPTGNKRSFKPGETVTGQEPAPPPDIPQTPTINPRDAFIADKEREYDANKHESGNHVTINIAEGERKVLIGAIENGKFVEPEGSIFVREADGTANPIPVSDVIGKPVVTTREEYMADMLNLFDAEQQRRDLANKASFEIDGQKFVDSGQKDEKGNMIAVPLDENGNPQEAGAVPLTPEQVEQIEQDKKAEAEAAAAETQATAHLESLKGQEPQAKLTYPMTKDGQPDIKKMDAIQLFNFNKETFGEERAVTSLTKSIRIKSEKIAELEKKIDKLEGAEETEALLSVNKLQQEKEKQEVILSEYQLSLGNKIIQDGNIQVNRGISENTQLGTQPGNIQNTEGNTANGSQEEIRTPGDVRAVDDGAVSQIGHGNNQPGDTKSQIDGVEDRNIPGNTGQPVNIQEQKATKVPEVTAQTPVVADNMLQNEGEKLPKAETGAEGQLNNLETKRAEIEQRRQEELNNKTSFINTNHRIGERYSINIASKFGFEGFDVDVSSRDDNKVTGFIYSKPLSQHFNTLREAKEYAQEILGRDKDYINEINARYDAELAALEQQKTSPEAELINLGTERDAELKDIEGKRIVGLNFENGKYSLSTFIKGESNSYFKDIELTQEERKELRVIEASRELDGVSGELKQRSQSLTQKIIERLGVDNEVTAKTPDFINAKYDALEQQPKQETTPEAELQKKVTDTKERHRNRLKAMTEQLSDQLQVAPAWNGKQNVNTWKSEILNNPDIPFEDKQAVQVFAKTISEVQSAHNKQIKALKGKELSERKPRSLSETQQKAIDIEAFEPQDLVKQYFIQGGKINKAALEYIFGDKSEQRTGKSDPAVEAERKVRIGYYAGEGKGKGVDEIAHELWEMYGDLTPGATSTDYRDAVISVIQGFNSTTKMAESILKAYGEQTNVEDIKDSEDSEVAEAVVDNSPVDETISKRIEQFINENDLDSNWFTEEDLLTIVEANKELLPENDYLTFKNYLDELIQRDSTNPFGESETGFDVSGETETSPDTQGEGNITEVPAGQPVREQPGQPEITPELSLEPPKPGSEVESEPVKAGDMPAEQTKLQVYRRMQREYDQLQKNFKSAENKHQQLKNKLENSPEFGNKGQADIFGNIAGSDALTFENDQATARETVRKAKAEVDRLREEVNKAAKELSRQKDKAQNQQGLTFDTPIEQKISEAKENQQIRKEEKKVNAEPSDAQKEAGNYKKGHVKVQGFDITIEQPKGSTRSGTDATGKQWSVTMNNTYGYFKRTKGKDGDQIDVFMGANPETGKAFVVDQNVDGKFDEHKVMLGFNSEQEATEAYLSNYEPGWKGLGAITEVSRENLKEWMKDGTRTKEPFAESQATDQPGKEPYQMTREEYKRENRPERIKKLENLLTAINIDEQPNVKKDAQQQIDEYYNSEDLLHKEVIKQALSEGREVPAEVLKDYPDLQKKEPSTPLEKKLNDIVEGRKQQQEEKEQGVKLDADVELESLDVQYKLREININERSYNDGNRYSLTINYPLSLKGRGYLFEILFKKTPTENEIEQAVRNKYKEEVDNVWDNIQNKPNDYRDKDGSIELLESTKSKLLSLHKVAPELFDNKQELVEYIYKVESPVQKQQAPAEAKPDIGKIISSSSRFRPRETIWFDTPLVGPSGAKLTSYTWSYEWTEDWNKVKGEPMEIRVSDWTNAEQSADTGRDIVHKFIVEMPDGTSQTVSSESVLVLLGLTDREQMKSFPSLVNAVKTLAKQKLQLAVLNDRLDISSKAEAEIKKMTKPEIERIEENEKFGGKRIVWRMGDTVVWDEAEVYDYDKRESRPNLTIGEERKGALEGQWEAARFKELGFDQYRDDSKNISRQIRELQERITRQERKVNEITKNKTEKEAKPETQGEEKKVSKRKTIVLDEGNGKTINDLWNEFNNIKDEKGQKEWAEKVKNTKFGTYGTISIFQVLDYFDPKYPNEVLKKDFISEIEEALNVPKNERKYKVDVESLRPSTNKKQEKQSEYRYHLTLRPFGIGTYPNENFVKWEDDGSQFGVLVYSDKVPASRVSHYSLNPITEAQALDGKTVDVGGYDWTLELKQNARGYNYFEAVQYDNGEEVDRTNLPSEEVLRNVERGSYIIKAESKPEPKAETKLPLEQKLEDIFKGKESKPSDIQLKNTTAPEAPIEDFGEKILGAKKDIYSRISNQLEATQDDVLTQGFAKVFPLLDYAKMVEAGAVTPEEAALLHYMREKIGVKPQKKYKINTWLSNIESYKNVLRWLTNKEDFKAKHDGKDFMELMNQSLSTYAVREIKDYVKLLTGVGFPANNVRLGDFKIMTSHAGELSTARKDENGRVVTNENGLVIYDKNTKPVYSITKLSNIVKNFDSYEQAVEALKYILTSTKEAPNQTKFEIYYNRSNPDNIIIGKKVGKNYIALVEGFKNSKEAQQYVKENQEGLEKLLEDKKTIPYERPESSRERAGLDRRNGKDATPEMFAEAFQFRGVQFGNWVEQGRRQSDLNRAYDALMDLADIIGVPPAALSLNGELGLAFGARGSGGKQSPVAHYEPTEIVINLTKKAGAGSLAHEWFHAVDNYFSRMRGMKNEFLTQKPYSMPNKDGTKDQKVREEVIDAIKEITNVIRKSGLAKRSKDLDERRTKDYWSQMLEMSARSFESYVLSKLQEKGISNDYLVSFLDIAAYSAQQGGDSYPYPTFDEAKVINPAFEKLFNTLQTKEEGGRTVLFRAISPIGYYSTVENALEKITQDKGTPEQFKAMLLENGAKQAEMDWMGFDDAFTGKSVTKAEVQDFINQNRIEVKEVEKGKTIKRWVISNKYGDYLTEDNTNGYIDNAISFDTEEEANNYFDSSDLYDTDYRVNQEVEEDKTDTKFSQYQLPGGENYKEVLLTMPEKTRYGTLNKTKNGEWEVTTPDGDKYVHENEIDARRQLKNIETNNKEIGFKSSHWDEANVVAHMRTSERTDTKERKILLVDEMQSDIAKRIRDIEALIAKGIATESDIKELENLKAITPFKKTGQWVNLALRRIMRYAAENGFDGIAWTPGNIQAERYDLSKQVDTIFHKKNSDGTYHIEATPKGSNDGSEKINDKAKESELEGLVGKEIAKKIINTPETEETYGGFYAISGLDLKVGGEGMKGFYDNIIPAQANKLGKPFGSKVETTTIDLNEGDQDMDRNLPESIPSDGIVEFQMLPVTESMREGVMEGVPLFKGIDNLGIINFATDKIANAKTLDQKHNAITDIVTRINESTGTISPVYVAKTEDQVFDLLKENGANKGNLASIRKSIADFKKYKNAEGKSLRLPGFFVNGGIYLISDNIVNANELVDVWLHETAHKVISTEFTLRELRELHDGIGKDKINELLPITDHKLKEVNKADEAIAYSINNLLQEYSIEEITSGKVDLSNLPLPLQFAVQRVLTRFNEYGNANNQIGGRSQVSPESTEGNSRDVRQSQKGKTGTNRPGSIGGDTPLERLMRMVIGERGAKSLDKSYESTIREDNNRIAKEMEAQGIDPKTIRLATGWEKGVDGEWRYEIPDGKFNDKFIKDLKRSSEFFVDENTQQRSGELMDILGNSDELFTAFPELNQIMVTVNVHPKNVSSSGSYTPGENRASEGLTDIDPEIKVFAANIKEAESVLLHEVQHAIQEIEGFAKGGNLMSAKASMTAEEQVELSNLYADLKDLQELRDDAEYGTETRRSAQKSINEIKKRIEELSPQRRYERLAGEVEARNVQSRMGMTPEQRRESTLQETEDVPREDQIITNVSGSKFLDERLSSGSYMPDKITIDGVERSTRNSKGQLIHPTRRGVENFYKWFGDSKVVDSKGNPLVVYHGTNSDFDTFDIINSAKNMDSGTIGKGFYFTTNPVNASNIAVNTSYNQSKERGGENVLPVYLKIVNPHEAAGLYDAWSGKSYLENNERSERYTDRLKNKGKDGVYLYLDKETDWYVAFSPNQIKSATGNNGEFNPDDNNIRFMAMPPKTPLEDIAESAGERYREGKNARRSWKEIRDGMREFYKDIDLPIRRLQERIKELGGVINDKSNPYRDITLAKGRLEALYREFTDTKMAPVLKTVAKIIKSGVKGDNILPYMISKHALERNPDLRAKEADKLLKEWIYKNQDATDAKILAQQLKITESLQDKDYSGVMEFQQIHVARGGEKYKNPEELAKAIVDSFESKVDKDLLKELWTNLKIASTATLDIWRAGNSMTQAEYEYQLNRYEHFVPLRGWREAAEKELAYLKGAGSGPRSLMEAQGRKSMAENPLAVMMNVAFKALGEQVDNEVNQAMLQLVVANYNKPEFKQMYELRTAYYVKGTMDDGTEGWVLSVDDKGMPTKPPAEKFEAGEATVKPYHEHKKRRTFKQAGEHELVVIDGSKTDQVIVFKGKMLNVAHSLKHQNVMYRSMLTGEYENANDWNNKIVNTLGAATNLVKQAYTSFNIVFPLTNFSRDAQEAALTQWIKGESGVAVVKNYKKSFPAILRDIYGKSNNSETDKLLRRFYLTGGATGYTHLKTPQQIERELNRELADILNKGKLKGTVGRNFRHLKNNVELWNRLFEDATRFSVFMSAIEAGHTDKDAASMAKEASVNFNRKGKSSKAFDAWWAFWNVALESMFKNFGLAKKAPARFATVAGGFALSGFLMALLNDMMDDDDDKDKNYYNISEFARYNYLLIPDLYSRLIKGESGDKYLRIPLPQFWRGFYASGSLLYDTVMGKVTPDKAAGKSLLYFVQGLSPVDIPGLYVDGKVSYAPLVPTVFRPFQEIRENRDFLGGRIYKEPFTLDQKERLAESGLGKDNVNLAIKFFTDLAFKMGGGEPDTGLKGRIEDGEYKKVPSILDINPSQIEHILKGYTGGTGGVITDAITTLGQVLNPEEDVDFRNAPFVNAFIRKMPEGKWATIRKFYDIKDDMRNYEKVQNEYKKIAFQGGNVERYKDAATNKYAQEYITTVNTYDNLLDLMMKNVSMKDSENSKQVLELMERAINDIEKLNKKYKR